jgi:DNA polymerase-3 subunit epsilon
MAMRGPGFAVVEFDTTGLMANDKDRAIEIAIVQLSAGGRIEQRWSTRLSVSERASSGQLPPLRYGSRVEVPEFRQVMGTVLGLLAGRVLVAHAAAFHLGFLARELERAGSPLPSDTVWLCTMQMARDFAPDVPRALPACSRRLSAEVVARPAGASTLVGDADQTAALLSTLIGLGDDHAFWERHLSDALDVDWPRFATRRAAPARVVDHAPDEPATFLARLTHDLPAVDGPAEHLDYLALVDRCLVHPRLLERESLSLVRLAERLNISRFVCESLHLDYFAALCDLAHRDGTVLTDDELAQLWAVGDLLDLPMSAILGALQNSRQSGVGRLLAG